MGEGNLEKASRTGHPETDLEFRDMWDHLGSFGMICVHVESSGIICDHLLGSSGIISGFISDLLGEPSGRTHLRKGI